MKRVVLLGFILVSFVSILSAQIMSGPLSPDRIFINPALKPFYHGVSSGDPLPDRVILWTRVTPDSTVFGSVSVNWEMALDTGFTQTVLTGSTSTDDSKDYTVHVDAIGLQPNTYYYYRFEALGVKSITGRTKTLPVGAAVDTLRFAVVSCSSFDAGYYHAYESIAKRNDVDAVLHLGDYIYEGGGTPFSADRTHSPNYEILGLMDYRMRHSQYKLDPDLRYAHQQYPFICVWDDHEIANDAWTGGAENHDPASEGDWDDRRYAATKAYAEWMPIRLPDPGDTLKIYRSFDYGDLVRLTMLDSRHYGRNEQSSSTNNDTSRTLLGNPQLQWFKNDLITSTAQWNLIGQQVMMAPLEVFGFPVNQDQWDGYPAERTRIWDYVMNNNIENFVVLTGDIHSSWANDLPYNSNYEPTSGENSVGVEYVTTSITSTNSPISFPLGVIQAANNHIKYADLSQHGYVILDVNRERTQGDWHYVSSTTDTAYTNIFGEGWYVNDAERFLRQANGPSVPSSIVNQIQAPLAPGFEIVTGISPAEASNIAMLASYPNPFTANFVVEYHIQKAADIQIQLSDMNGKTLKTISVGRKEKGLHAIRIESEDLPSGNYFMTIFSDKVSTGKWVLKVK